MGSALGALVATPALAQGTTTTDKPLQAGLAFLEREQAQPSGAFGNGAYRDPVAITSLAALAFMSAGHFPRRTALGKVVEAAGNFILGQAKRDGTLGEAVDRRGTAYAQGFGTLCLASLHGMFPGKDVAIRNALARSVALVVGTQHEQGSWRYLFEAQEAGDLSVTVALTLALHACRDAAIDVPERVFQRAAEYVMRCQFLPDGGFQYQPRTGAPTFPLTAAAIVALASSGHNQGANLDAAYRYLATFDPAKPPPTAIHPDHFLYGHYYAAQAMRLRGGPVAERWQEGIREKLLGTASDGVASVTQRKDGSWLDAKFGSHYATAMACLILQAPRTSLRH